MGREQYPEFDWQWEWEQAVIDSQNRRLKDPTILEDTLTTNMRTANPELNINPTELIYSVYPWSYDADDFAPREKPWVAWLINEKKGINAARDAHAKLVSGSAKSSVTNEELSAFYDEKIARSQANFYEFNGWVFWDTEDDWEASENNMGPKRKDRTKTHMDVARVFEFDEDWASGSADNRAGGKTCYLKGGDLYEYMAMNAAVDPADYQTGGIRMDYCCTTPPTDAKRRKELLDWPDSHLCIYAHGKIDPTAYKFKTGSIGWDTENGEDEYPKIYGNKVYLDPKQELGFLRAVPIGRYHISYDGHSDAFINQNVLCTKENLHLEHEIEVPRDVPFYLMQFIGSCQFVSGMHITKVELRWATEVNHKTAWLPSLEFDSAFIELEMNSWGHAIAWGRRDQLPDGHFDQDFISIKYCFYQPTVIERPAGGKSSIFADNMNAVSMDYEGGYDKMLTLTEDPQDYYCAKEDNQVKASHDHFEDP